MVRKTVVQKSHLTAGRKATNVRRSEEPPVCWTWPEKNRILFVDKTRDRQFAAYYVSAVYCPDRGQRKTRLTLLVPQPLRGYMQMKLDDYAESQGYEKCRKGVYDSVQQALKTGEQL